MTSDRGGGGYLGARMSVRADAAYADDARPLSKITAAWMRDHNIPCSRAELLDLIASNLVVSSEWHHTGKHFTETDFYRPADVREQVEVLSRDEIAAARAEVRRERGQAGTAHRNCEVDWLEWPGHGRGRTNRPEEHHAEGATVWVRGQYATVTLPDGNSFRKRLDTNGFTFTTPEDRRRQAEAARERRALARAEAREWKALQHRFTASVTGAKLASCDYFKWRDIHDRDIAAVVWTPITRKAVIAALRESGLAYARRTVERLEAGDREVVRVGIRMGLRRVT